MLIWFRYSSNGSVNMKVVLLITWVSLCVRCEGYDKKNQLFCDAINKLNRAKTRVNSIRGQCRRASPGPVIQDCSQVVSQSSNTLSDGVYQINPGDGKGAFDVYCEMTKGEAWLVIQRREDGSRDFFRGWADYEDGFGVLSHEFWLGNDKISRITSQRQYELRIEMTDFNGESIFADYENFLVGNVSTAFRLELSGFSGNKGDALKIHNHMMFSTRDFDNDKSPVNCAQLFMGAWWYNDCMASNLNGHYREHVPSHGIVWETWKNERLKTVVMKIRPKTKTSSIL